MTEYETGASSLERNNFSKITDTNLYQNGDFFVEPGPTGLTTIYSTFAPELTPDRVGSGHQLTVTALGYNHLQIDFYEKSLQYSATPVPATLLDHFKKIMRRSFSFTYPSTEVFRKVSFSTLENKLSNHEKTPKLPSSNVPDLTTQLAKAGFTNTNPTQNPSTLPLVFSKMAPEGTFQVIVEPDNKVRLLKPVHLHLIDPIRSLAYANNIQVAELKTAIYPNGKKEARLVLESASVPYTLAIDANGKLDKTYSELKAQIDPERLEVKVGPVTQDSNSFTINGGSVQENMMILENLQTQPEPKLNGKRIQSIERAMKSGSTPMLSNNTELLKHMLTDAKTVVDLPGDVTHQQLAEPFLYALAAHTKGFGSFIWNGKKYQISANFFLSGTESPFNVSANSKDVYGNIVTNPDVTDIHNVRSTHGWINITNVETGNTFHFEAILPYLIRQFGFYGDSPSNIDTQPESSDEKKERLLTRIDPSAAYEEFLAPSSA